MRRVVDTKTVCKLFTLGLQDRARTPTHTLSFLEPREFEGIRCRDLFSYTTKIATMLQEDGHDDLLLITDYSYSVTTNKQIGYLHESARSRGIKMLYVDDLEYWPIGDMMLPTWLWLMHEAGRYLDKAKRARSRKPEHLARCNARIDDANFVAKRFDLNVPIASYETFLDDVAAYNAMEKLKE